MIGSKPTFNKPLPIIQPTLPKVEELTEDLKKIFSSYEITNANYVKKLEERIKDYIGVKYAVCISSATAGLILVFKALNIKGEVIVPSFTFSATVQSLIWNNLKPVFVDCKLDNFNIDEDKIEEKITKNTVAILAVYIYGLPPNIAKLEKIAKKYKLKLVFDAAHALGSEYKGIKAGNFGDAEVFSLSPTKLVVAGEGGIVTTNNKELANKIKIGRDYANPGNYNSQFVGLNARMTEINALIGLKNLEKIEERINYRNELSQIYKENLKDIPGITFQKINEDTRSTINYFPILIDKKKFGITCDKLFIFLEKENIKTKKYFYPAVHNQKFIKELTNKKFHLPITEYVSKNILCLPMYSHLKKEDVIKVCNAIRKIYEYNKVMVTAQNIFGEKPYT